ncbi:MAG: thymidine kinase [Acidimicrobiia bacterium]|nr:thymidine kinase [Acidimicrobiia bacterium]
MGSGKSTMALQIHHNLTQVGQHGLLLTQLDRLEAAVSSRLGVALPAIEVHPDLDLSELARSVRDEVGVLHFMVCDEAQFYLAAQVDQLAEVVDELDVDVWAFGLLTDFRGKLFDATARFLELADSRQELQVEARCWCNRPATHNARVVDGHQVYEGDTVLVGDVGTGQVSYELLCRRHWTEGRARAGASAAGDAEDLAARGPGHRAAVHRPSPARR